MAEKDKTESGNSFFVKAAHLASVGSVVADYILWRATANYRPVQQEVQEDIYDALFHSREPLTMDEIAEMTGYSDNDIVFHMRKLFDDMRIFPYTDESGKCGYVADHINPELEEEVKRIFAKLAPKTEEDRARLREDISLAQDAIAAFLEDNREDIREGLSQLDEAIGREGFLSRRIRHIQFYMEHLPGYMN